MKFIGWALWSIVNLWNVRKSMACNAFGDMPPTGAQRVAVRFYVDPRVESVMRQVQLEMARNMQTEIQEAFGPGMASFHTSVHSNTRGTEFLIGPTLVGVPDSFDTFPGYIIPEEVTSTAERLLLSTHMIVKRGHDAGQLFPVPAPNEPLPENRVLLVVFWAGVMPTPSPGYLSAYDRELLTTGLWGDLIFVSIPRSPTDLQASAVDLWSFGQWMRGEKFPLQPLVFFNGNIPESGDASVFFLSASGALPHAMCFKGAVSLAEGNCRNVAGGLSTLAPFVVKGHTLGAINASEAPLTCRFSHDFSEPVFTTMAILQDPTEATASAPTSASETVVPLRGDVHHIKCPVPETGVTYGTFGLDIVIKDGHHFPMKTPVKIQAGPCNA